MKRTERILSFVKRNAFYMVLALCIVAVGVSVVLMLANEPDGSLGTGDDIPSIEEPVDKPDETPSDPVDKPDETPSDPVDKPDDTTNTPVDKPIVFDMPVKDVVSIGEFSETMVFNSTLGRYSTHKAIDFFASEGTDVFAVYDGTIADVQSTLLKGTTITIDHGNGLKTVYNSLADGDLRNLRIQAHRTFDMIWRNNIMTRKNAYRWIQDKFSLRSDQAHIGYFSEYMCHRLIDESRVVLENNHIMIRGENCG